MSLSRFGDEFNAFGLVPLVQNTPFKISSLASYNDHVYVGTKDGKIVVFRNTPGSAELLSARLHRSKPVTSLIIAGPLQYVLALCGGKVFALDLYTLQRAKQIENEVNKHARGASIFCMDRSGPPLWRLCFGVKRKLVIFEHKGETWSLLKELALPEPASVLCWFGPSICVGYKHEYNIIKVSTGQTVKAGPVLDSGDQAYLNVLPGPHIVAAGMAEVGVLLDLHGNPTSGVVGWSGVVNSSVYTYPYLVSLVQTRASDKGNRDGRATSDNTDGGKSGGAASSAAGIVGGLFGGSSSSKSLGSRVIEIHSVVEQYKLVQTIHVPPDAVMLADSLAYLSGATSEKKSRRKSIFNHRGSMMSSLQNETTRAVSQLFFASSTAIYQINMIDIQNQVSQLLHLIRVESALNLVHATTPAEPAIARERVLAKCYQDAGLTLFVNLMFEQATPHLCQSYFDLRELLQLFPELQPIEGLGEEFKPKLLLPRSQGGTLPNNATSMLALIKTAKSKKAKAALKNPVFSSGSDGNKSSDDLENDDVLMEMAYKCMLNVFEERRRKVLNGQFEEGVATLRMHHTDNYQDETQLLGTMATSLNLIETCIFNLYVLLPDKDQELVNFVQEENKVQISDATGVLQRKKLFHVLALLNASKGRDREALEIWMRIGSHEYQDASGKEGVKETVDHLCNLGNTKNSIVDSEDIMLSEDMNHLVWTFSSWVLRKNPSEGICIFTESNRPKELPADRVLEFLASFLNDESGAKEGDDANGANEKDVWPREARVAFLEYLIGRDGGAEQHYHTQLALELVHMTIHALAHGYEPSGKVKRRRYTEFGSIGKSSDLVDRLSNPGGAVAMGKWRSGKSSSYGKYPPVRRKLLNLLRSKNSKFNNAQVLAATTGKGLHEERVLLLGNSGSHVDALHILVNDLHDLAEAEKYCAEHSPSLEADPSHAHGLFLPLIKIYLERGDQRTAMDLLQRHAHHVDPIQVLNQLPEGTNLATLKPFLQNMIRHSMHRYSQAMITKNLAKTRNLNVRCDLAALETRAAVVTTSTTCCVCGYGIVSNTVFVVFPAGEIAHLKCCRKGLDVHPLPPHEPLQNHNREKAFLWKIVG